MNFRSHQVVRIIPENWYGTIVGDENPLIVNGEYSIIIFEEFAIENNKQILVSVNPSRMRHQYE